MALYDADLTLYWTSKDLHERKEMIEEVAWKKEEVDVMGFIIRVYASATNREYTKIRDCDKYDISKQGFRLPMARRPHSLQIWTSVVLMWIIPQ